MLFFSNGAKIPGRETFIQINYPPLWLPSKFKKASKLTETHLSPYDKLCKWQWAFPPVQYQVPPAISSITEKCSFLCLWTGIH